MTEERPKKNLPPSLQTSNETTKKVEEEMHALKGEVLTMVGEIFPIVKKDEENYGDIDEIVGDIIDQKLENLNNEELSDVKTSEDTSNIETEYRANINLMMREIGGKICSTMILYQLYLNLKSIPTFEGEKNDNSSYQKVKSFLSVLPDDVQIKYFENGINKLLDGVDSNNPFKKALLGILIESNFDNYENQTKDFISEFIKKINGSKELNDLFFNQWIANDN